MNTIRLYPFWSRLFRLQVSDFAMAFAALFAALTMSHQAWAQTEKVPSKYKTLCELEDEEAASRNELLEALTPRGLRPIVPPVAQPVLDWRKAANMLIPRKPHEKPKELRFDPKLHTGAIAIKFAEDSGILVVNGQFASPNVEGNFSLIDKIVRDSNIVFTISSLFTRSAEHLKADKLCGERNEGITLADLSLWVRLVPKMLAKSLNDQTM